MRPEVLFISPHREDARCLSHMLHPLPLKLEHVQDVEQARTKLQHGQYQVVLTDTDLPDGAWLDVLNLAKQLSPEAEVVVTDRLADAGSWVEFLNLGAYDLLPQPFAASEVQRILSNACTHALA